MSGCACGVASTQGKFNTSEEASAGNNLELIAEPRTTIKNDIIGNIFNTLFD